MIMLNIPTLGYLLPSNAQYHLRVAGLEAKVLTGRTAFWQGAGAQSCSALLASRPVRISVVQLDLVVLAPPAKRFLLLLVLEVVPCLQKVLGGQQLLEPRVGTAPREDAPHLLV